ncbi:hypothetical protein H6G89_09005 [Oscillatoria sp. FACHB-1407]|uniref:hypothetical protein n=1 Tax=Oscillatoria sp. FACHB-1407 TaxID=2692847 RepID=UPI001684C253|nr:hypothetical protein [Oscillatoria sp. FACHB-1407]MBD2461181.1 hypothetical protein [Oscillatoria sp. FACHB-1407]
MTADIPNDSEQFARFSMTQSLGRFSFLWLITLGIYGLHWHYMNWRAFGFGKFSSGFFALFSGFAIYGLARRIFQLATGQGMTVGVDPAILLFACVLGGILSNRTPGFWFILGLPLILIPTLYLQQFLNTYWSKVKPDRPQRPLFSGGFFVWTIVGVILWGLTIVGILMEMGLIQEG